MTRIMKAEKMNCLWMKWLKLVMKIGLKMTLYHQFIGSC